MNAKEFVVEIYVPAVKGLREITQVPWSHPVDQMLVTIAGQESAWTHRRQINGPARGFWQFERGGGVAGVIAHPASRQIAAALIKGCEIGRAHV